MEIEALNTPQRVATRDNHASRVGESWLSSALAELSPQETIMLLFAALFVTVALVAYSLVEAWPGVILRMSIVTAVIFGMNRWSAITQSPIRRGLKLFYLVPIIPVFFKTAELISFPIHGHDCDSILEVADRLMCGGVNPTQWLYQHFPTPPALTEYMTICYSLFYFLPVALVIEFYRKGWKKETDDFFFLIVYGFLLSYVAYFLLPSVGPRFTLHDFTAMSRELPGLFLTEPIRTLLNRGENIIPGMPLSDVMRAVTRDAFPSGHTDITLLTIIIAFKYRARLRWAILLFGSSLIFSTVYLRYHYVIDLVGGALFALVTLYTWEWVRDRMIRLQRALV